MKSFSTLFLLVSILLVIQPQNINAQENQTYSLTENISYRTADEEKQDEYIAERCKLRYLLSC
jgi:cell division protein FtsB